MFGNDLRSFPIAKTRNEGATGGGVNLGNYSAAMGEVSFWLFVTGAIAGLLQSYRPIAFGAGYEMVDIAINLAKSGNFANPFVNVLTGSTAVEPPLYPIFLAMIITLLKLPILVKLAVVFLNICINALVAALLPRVSLLFFGDLIPGIFAGAGWILSVRLMPCWDTSYTVAGLLLFCLFSASLVKKADRAWIAGAVSGLFAGSLFLLNTSSMLVSLPWIGYLLMGRPLRPKRMVAYCGALLAVFALFGAAWVLRNDLELGVPVLRTNLGMTLYASNNDCAQPSLIDEERQGCYGKHHPNEGASEAHLLGTLGEVEYDRKRLADARNWMINHRRRFVELTVQRYRDFWFPPTELHPFSAYLISIATAVSILGLVLLAWHRQRIILFVVLVLWSYPLMYYVVVSDIRYRYPVLWISLLAAGYAANAISQFTRDRLLESPSWAGK